MPAGAYIKNGGNYKMGKSLPALIIGARTRGRQGREAILGRRVKVTPEMIEAGAAVLRGLAAANLTDCVEDMFVAMIRVKNGRRLANVSQHTGTELKPRVKRKRLYLKCQGHVLSVSEWAAKTGLHVQTIHSRIRCGWSDEDCLEPLKRPNPHLGSRKSQALV